MRGPEPLKPTVNRSGPGSRRPDRPVMPTRPHRRVPSQQVADLIRSGLTLPLRQLLPLESITQREGQRP